MSLFQRQADASQIDNELMLRNDRIGIKANSVGKRNISKQMTPLENELVKEYVDKYPQRYDYEAVETDPNTGEQKTVTKYRKYRIPQDKPDLELEDLDDLENFSPQRITTFIAEVDRRMEEVAKDIADFEEKIDMLNADERRADNQYNNGDITTGRFTELINAMARRRKLLTSQLAMAQDDYRTLPARKDTELARANQANARNTVIRQNNADKTKAYQQELNLLNRGQFSTEKREDETEQEYLDRLEENAQVEAPDEELESAKILALRNFRDKLRELFRQPSKIDAVANSIDAVGEVDNKLQLIKKWALVKRKWTETYGSNQDATVPEIIDFLQKFINNPNNPIVDEIPPPIAQASSSTAVIGNEGKLLITPIPSADMVQLTKGDGEPVFIKTLIVKQGKATNSSTLILLYSFTGLEGSFREWFEIGTNMPYDRGKVKTSTEIKNHTNISYDEIQKIFGGVSPSAIAKKLAQTYGINPLTLNDPRVIQIPYSTIRDGKEDKIQYGVGIKPEQLPDWATFGKLIIKVKKLYYNNELIIKYKNKKSINGFKNVKVSEKFVKIIMNMFEDISPTHEDLNRLSANERHLYDMILMMAELHKKMPHHADKTVTDLKKQLKMAEAEVEIGNNSPLVISHIHNILNSLKMFKVITDKQLKEYMKQFH